MKARILSIEGKRAETPSFIPSLAKKGYQVEAVSTGRDAIARLSEFDPDLVIVYSASLRTSGKRICSSLRQHVDGLPIVVISGPQQQIPKDVQANVILKLPFTARKLINRIVRLLPGDGKHMLLVGPIRLDLEGKRVRCQGREARLTPRLTILLQVLMTHPGEVVERDQLFREVWDTNYTGDTRTLDVHISWLRRAIEEDPRKPKLLKTFRGVGYRLDA